MISCLHGLRVLHTRVVTPAVPSITGRVGSSVPAPCSWGIAEGLSPTRVYQQLTCFLFFVLPRSVGLGPEGWPAGQPTRIPRRCSASTVSSERFRYVENKRNRLCLDENHQKARLQHTDRNKEIGRFHKVGVAVWMLGEGWRGLRWVEPCPVHPKAAVRSPAGLVWRTTDGCFSLSVSSPLSETNKVPSSREALKVKR